MQSSFEILTKAVRSVPVANLSLEYVSYSQNKYGALAQYPVAKVIADYSTYDKALAALIEVFEKSDCPLVAKYRQALAHVFSAAHDDELEQFKSGGAQ